MLTAAKASHFAQEWIEAWNSHDLNRIVAHYSDSIIFSSPFVASVGRVATGCLCGREALRVYFKAALSGFPSLHFGCVRLDLSSVREVYRRDSRAVITF
jgi:ketosteroid isomerase-like protein